MATIHSPGAFCILLKECNQEIVISNDSGDYNFYDTKPCELISLGKVAPLKPGKYDIFSCCSYCYTRPSLK